MTSPCDRLPGESSKAYVAFCLYRDLGPRRSIDEASRLYHHTNHTDAERTQSGRRTRASGKIRFWANHWHWSARAAAWDQEIQRVKRIEQVEAVKEMAERHAKEALMIQNKAVERLRQLRPEELKPREMLDFLVAAAKLERLARGEPTERVAQEHRFADATELTDDELALIVASGRGRVLPSSGEVAQEKNGEDVPV